MQCCASCFDDRGLRQQIIPTFSKDIGTCSYCGSANENLVPPSALRDGFELLLSIYVEDKDGRTFADCLKDDWGMFKNPKMDHANASILLSEILDDAELVRKKFRPARLCESNRLDLWGSFRAELMHENRFFPKRKLDENQLKEMLAHLQIDPYELGNTWYRARIRHKAKPYSNDEMGAPPKERASHGRANPIGIPYLYLASNPDTAISEIRPHTGETADVARFTITKSLVVVDLRDPKSTISPFTIGEEETIARLRDDIEFLIQLGKELKRPVLPHVAAIDYLPSQYLCEFIKSQTYDGVIYGSSVGEGVNLALFEPSLARIEESNEVRVSKVTVELEKN